MLILVLAIPFQLIVTGFFRIPVWLYWATLYGTAFGGSSSGFGTVFAVNTDGTGFTNLYNFNPPWATDPFLNVGGFRPVAGLFLSRNILYGTAAYGGNQGSGTVFKVNPDGTSFSVLYTFSALGGFNPRNQYNYDGGYPSSVLILSGNTLYGTTLMGGSPGWGTLFSINTNGTGFTNLHIFTGGSDGANPGAGLILSSNTLYGTAGGAYSGYGTVFAIKTDGTGFTNLHSFTGGSDGSGPGAFVLAGNTLYGEASGGSNGRGTLFKINTDGTGFTNLYNFSVGGYDSSTRYTNSDGANPGGLILSANTLYGTTSVGGSSGSGTFFCVNTNGAGFTVLHTLSAGVDNLLGGLTNSDGMYPGGLIKAGNTLYGTASYGGSSGNGTVFSFFIHPNLTLAAAGPNVILTWPTNASGFILQSTTNLVSPVWTTNSPAPIVVNGQNVVTNPLSGTQQFFRLSQ